MSKEQCSFQISQSIYIYRRSEAVKAHQYMMEDQVNKYPFVPTWELLLSLFLLHLLTLQNQLQAENLNSPK